MLCVAATALPAAPSGALAARASSAAPPAAAAATWSPQRTIYHPGGVAPFAPAGAAVASDSLLYVASSGSDDVVRVDHDGSRSPLGVPGLNRPRDIAPDVAAGRLWVLDTTDNELVLITTSGAVIRTLRPGLKSPFGVVAGSAGVYVADSYNHRVILLNPTSGARLWAVSGCNGGFSRPRDVAIGPDGLVYVADTDHNRIAVLDPGSGACVRSFGGAGSQPGRFSGLRSLVSDGSSGLYTAESHGRRVQHVSLFGVPIAASARGPVQVPACVYAIPATSRVGVCDTFRQSIQLYDESGATLAPAGAITGPAPVPGGFNQPFGVAYGPAGEMYVTDMFNHRVQKFAPDGSFERQWGSFGTAPTQLTFPRGIAVSADGSQVVVTDSENDRLAIYTPQGSLIRTVRAKNLQTGWPHQTALDPDGSFWLADTNKNRVLHLAADGTVLGQFNHGGQVKQPRGIALDEDGYVYVASSGSSRVLKFTKSGGLVATLATPGSGATGVRVPWNLAVYGSGPDARLFVADGNNNRVLVLTLDGAPDSVISGGSGNAKGTPVFSSPRGVAVHPLTGDVAAADFYGYDVTVWRSGP